MKVAEVKKFDVCKNQIMSNSGKNIDIKMVNKQGKLLKQYVGVIVETYNSVFIVKVTNFPQVFNKSFSYIDFFTNEMSYEIY